MKHISRARVPANHVDVLNLKYNEDAKTFAIQANERLIMERVPEIRFLVILATKAKSQDILIFKPLLCCCDAS